MAKPRGNSDPLSSSLPSGYCSFTTLAGVSSETKTPLAEPYSSISASALLCEDVSHSGWIRKEGFSVRTWRTRFMILHHGCLYYFKETNSSSPKGKFGLNGYRCEIAPERDKADKYSYVFKLAPEYDHQRTYYFSSPSKSEMEGWIKDINNDIRIYCSSPDEFYDYVDAGPIGEPKFPTLPKEMPPIPNRRNHGSLPSSPDITIPNPFPSPGSYHLNNNPNQKVNTLGSPRKAPVPPKRPSRPGGDTAVGVHQGSNSGYEPVGGQSEPMYLPVISDYQEQPGSDKPNQNVGGSGSAQSKAPVPPKRSPRVPPAVPMDFDGDSDSQDDSSSDGEYLDLREVEREDSISDSSGGNVSQNVGHPTMAQSKAPVPPRRPSRKQQSTPMGNPHYPGSQNIDAENADPEELYLEVVANDEDKAFCEEYNRQHQTGNTKPPPKPPPKPKPQQPPVADNVEFDYLPKDCYKPDLHKSQAKVFLELSRNLGMYIVHASQTSHSKLALSVWTSTGIKHYLIFKAKDMFTLDPSITDERFPDLRTLVKYYYSIPLPKSTQCLIAPFK